MANLASVFPVIFFLVAALVCLTTMTRMVEEQRTQIGLMKALGYGRWDISKKYLCYGLFPSLAGSLLGIIIGHIVFPTMIYVSYQIMYEMPNIRLSLYPGICIWATIAAVACTTLSTLWACISTLTDSPANLMRPKAPPAGKRVLLERITPVWRALSFNWKITVRNLFRYKKRFFMTVIGIGGCTGLIIAGFGLRDSLMMTMDTQYGDIFRYDAQITLSDGLLDTEYADIKEYLDSSYNVSEYTEIYAGSVTAESPAYSITAYVEVFDPEDIGKFVITRAIGSGDEMTLPESGVIIDQKLSELLKVNVGDSITIDSDGRHSAKIAGIYQNYVAHFIYLTPAAYEDIFGDEAEINTVILNLEDNSNAACEATMEEMLKLHGVSAASRTADVKDTYMHSMERVDFVVVVVILCAAALAIVVLYNLSNINMTERIRELATIKVLGFYDIEVTTYLCRENIILTAAGIALGCVFGKYLHAWLIRSVEIDLMMFGRSTTAMSYAFSAALTVIFSAIVNVMAHVKMKGIDMIESLKSAE
jgi:putative ABC transport system permease protein